MTTIAKRILLLVFFLFWGVAYYLPDVLFNYLTLLGVLVLLVVAIKHLARSEYLFVRRKN